MILENENTLRMAVFFGVLITMMVWEAAFPRKIRTQTRVKRWLTNIGLVISYGVVLRVLFPVMAVGVAIFAHTKGWGVLNLVDLPVWVEVGIAVLVLDFAVYWQHVISHKVPMFWALHKVHHADRDIDASTGIRFHPGEVVLSMLYKMVWVLVLGPSVVGIIVFEVLLNGSAMFNHANLRLPIWVDRGLRSVVVTPDMHRVHHSVVALETNSNYGFFLSVWDRVFGSYIAQPEAGHDDMVIGLPEYQSEKPSNIVWCLFLPFRRKP